MRILVTLLVVKNLEKGLEGKIDMVLENSLENILMILNISKIMKNLISKTSQPCLS